MLGKSLIKWRQRHDMTIAVDWDVKHQFKQSSMGSLKCFAQEHYTAQVHVGIEPRTSRSGVMYSTTSTRLRPPTSQKKQIFVFLRSLGSSNKGKIRYLRTTLQSARSEV